MKHLPWIFSLIVASMSVTTLTFAEDENSVLKPLTEEQLKDQAKGQALLDKIMTRQPRFGLIGTLEQDSTGTFSVNGEAFFLNSDTRVDGNLVVGLPISVHGFVEEGKKVARVVTVGSPTSSASGSAEIGTANGTALDVDTLKKPR